MSLLTGDILNDTKLEVSYLEDEQSYIVVMTPKKGEIKKKLKEIILLVYWCLKLYRVIVYAICHLI